MRLSDLYRAWASKGCSPETDAETTATSLVVFEYVVVGASFQNLDKLAPIVEGVLNTQMTRLAQS